MISFRSRGRSGSPLNVDPRILSAGLPSIPQATGKDDNMFHSITALVVLLAVAVASPAAVQTKKMPWTLSTIRPAAQKVTSVQTKKITYKDGAVECHGFLAWDDAVKGPRPGV